MFKNETDFQKCIRYSITKAFENSFEFKYFGEEHGVRGMPDILACVKGVFVGIEAKIVPNRPEVVQLVQLERIHKAGGVALLMFGRKDRDVVHIKRVTTRDDIYSRKEIDTFYTLEVKEASNGLKYIDQSFLNIQIATVIMKGV